MAIEEKERIIIPDETGAEHLFEVVFTFDVDATGNSYVVVTPVSDETHQHDDEEEDVEVFAFRYEEKENDDDDIALFQIETDEEWDIVEEMINTFSDEEE